MTASGPPGSSPELAQEVISRRRDLRAGPRASPPGSSSTQPGRFGEVRLRIAIDDEHLPTSIGKCRAEVCGRGGLYDPAPCDSRTRSNALSAAPHCCLYRQLYVGLSVRLHVCQPARLHESPDGTVRRCSYVLIVSDRMWQVGKHPSPGFALQVGTQPLDPTASDLVVRQRLDPVRRPERLRRQRPHRVPEQPVLRAPLRQRRANTQWRRRHPGFRATNALRAHARNKAAPRLQPREQRYPPAALRGRSWPCRWLPK